ncbi:MAG: hypothetical protein JWO88_1088 [Frankiales bacterium]|nr:hypothetical protein [Frankiales bacterium]
MDEISNGAEPARKRGRGRKIGTAAAVGLGLTLGAAGIAAAATDPSPSPSGGATAQAAPQPPPPGQRGPGRGFGRGPGGGHRGGRGLGPGGALHGDFVLPNAGGGYRNVRMQHGVVTSVSTTSLTVKSDDGYTQTYVLTAATLVDAGRDGIATVKKGESVAVLGTVVGKTATANEVRDLTKIQTERKQFAPRGGSGPARPAPSGTPASPSSYNNSGDVQGA